jgi:flagellin-like hook-associated protein FlgL
MSEVRLTSAVRDNLLSLQRNTQLLSRTTERLTTKVKVAHPHENPINYFAAKTYSNKADALTLRLDGMSEAVQMIKSADNGITSINEYLVQMSGLIQDALTTSSQSDRRSLGTQFNELITQIRDIANDSEYAGVNLLIDSEATDVRFAENAKGTTYEIRGVNISAAEADPDTGGELGASEVVKTATVSDAFGATSMVTSEYALTFDMSGEGIVGVRSAGTNGDAHEIDWGSDDYLDTLMALGKEVADMGNALKAQSTMLAADLATINNRQDYTEDFISILNEGSDDLVLADLNEEAANQLSLQNAVEIGVQTLSLAADRLKIALQLLS